MEMTHSGNISGFDYQNRWKKGQKVEDQRKTKHKKMTRRCLEEAHKTKPENINVKSRTIAFFSVKRACCLLCLQPFIHYLLCPQCHNCCSKIFRLAYCGGKMQQQPTKSTAVPLYQSDLKPHRGAGCKVGRISLTIALNHHNLRSSSSCEFEWSRTRVLQIFSRPRWNWCSQTPGALRVRCVIFHRTSGRHFWRSH